MEQTFRNLFIMLVSAYLTLIVPPWLLPVTVGAGLLMLVKVIRDMRKPRHF
jgi:hypothetical protein